MSDENDPKDPRIKREKICISINTKMQDRQDDKNTSIRSLLVSNFSVFEERENAPYDGVLGSPPDWFPDWHKNEFRTTRDHLLDTLLADESRPAPPQVLKWMDDYDSWGEIDGVNSVAYVPTEVTDDVHKLARYRAIALLDRQKGLAALDSKAAPFSSGGAHKKGKYQEPKASISMIVKRVGSRSFDDVIEVLRDADKCADWFHDTSEPIGVDFIAVNDDTKTIKYLKRGDHPDNPKRITYKRLQNILSQLK